MAADSSCGSNNRSRSLEHQPRRRDRLTNRRDFSVELLFVDRFQAVTDARAGSKAEGQQMASEEQRRRRSMFDAERPRPLEKPVHRGTVEPPGAPPFAVGLCQAREQL